MTPRHCDRGRSLLPALVPVDRTASGPKRITVVVFLFYPQIVRGHCLTPVALAVSAAALAAALDRNANPRLVIRDLLLNVRA